MKHVAIFAILMLFAGCKSGFVDAQYEGLKDGETKFLLNVDGKTFYEDDAVFEGHLEAKENYFVMNFLNQYDGNFILNFSGVEKWYDQKPVEGKLYGTSVSNLMVGKVVDKEKRMGAGYLMSEGNIVAISVSKDKLILKVEGKLKKYPNVNEEDPSFKFDGYIISKKPNFSEYSIPNG